jgi:hypothetical protein
MLYCMPVYRWPARKSNTPQNALPNSGASPTMDLPIHLTLYLVGAFAVVLGILHFFFPLLFDFGAAIPLAGPSLRPFRLPGIRYATTRRDVLGIAWIMNHCVSYTIVTIGVIDLLLSNWLGSTFGRATALWIAGFYAIRAASQLYLGHRRGDWLILTGFGVLALVHIIVAFV